MSELTSRPRSVVARTREISVRSSQKCQGRNGSLPMTSSTTPSGKPFPPVTRSPSFRALAAPERDSFGSNHHRVCREGKPLHTFMRWLRKCRRPQTWGRRPDSGCASGNYFCTHAATSELTPFAALAMSAATTSASNHRVRPQSHSNNGRALTRRQ